MNIDRSNYEVWFIDWLDGNLKSSQLKELYSFLDLNPDLKDEFNDLTNIPFLSPELPCPFKDVLKRSADEISESQFGYLCAARLENDLSESQNAELDEIIANNPEKKRVSDLINKTRLSPVNINYKHKKQLLKRTPAQSIIRLSVMGLSAAAVITLIVTTYLTVPHNMQDNNMNEAVIFIPVPDNILKQPPTGMIPDIIGSPDNNQPETENLKANKLSVFSPDKTSVPQASLAENNKEDTTVRNRTGDVVEKIENVEPGRLSQNADIYDLASSYIFIPDEEPDNGRSRIGKYIAKTFREKFLKEKTPHDSPLKAYEIAEAGVTGINKILGWEMALDKKNDQNGNLKSVYFSSRILKFNAPVKKSEPLP